MSLLKQLLNELTTKKEIEQLRELCDKISNDEILKYKEVAPLGSRVFLCINVPGRNNKEIGFLTLEQESLENYILVYHILNKTQLTNKSVVPKRVRVWEVNEFKPKKVMKQFLEIAKMLLGNTKESHDALAYG